MKRLLLSFCALLWLGAAHAAVDTYEFSTELERKRYTSLVAELRCPKCQNQNLADSNAPIAMDLREQVYQMLKSGSSDREIVDHLVLRYGDFVRYKPPFDQRTWLLWVGPAFLLGLGALFILLLVRRKRRGATKTVSTLSAEEDARLANLLDKKDS